MNTTAGSSFRREIYCALAIFAICLWVRWPLLSQSLWYDEMTTLGEYVLQPWHRILWPMPGEYVPNNHVLHTLLAKIVYTLGTRGGDILPPREALLRLPAVIAGSLVPIALAWPLRRREPLLALGIAMVAGLHPWLVAFSVEARGYSLMLLLGILATNLLPDGRRRWPIGYAIALTLAVYTVPLAILLIPAHAVVIFVNRLSRVGGVLKTHTPDLRYSEEPGRTVERYGSSQYLRTGLGGKFTTAQPFLTGIAMALVLVSLLYLPMFRGLWSYYLNPYPATMGYRQFWDALPRFALSGERLPRRPNPYFHQPDSSADAIYWALPVLTIVIGSAFAWSRQAIRPMLLTMGTMTLLGVLLPLLVPGATEVRFVPWIIPWFCIAAVSLFAAARARYAKFAAVFGMLTLISWQITMDVKQLPTQSIREGIHRADEITPAGRNIIVLYIGAREAVALYGDQAVRHELIPAPDTGSFVLGEQSSKAMPWVIIFYEQLARDRDRNGPPETRGLWSELARNYRPVLPRLPGRLTPVTIYAPIRESPLKRSPRGISASLQ